MTSEGSVEMFEGDSAETCVDGGPSGGSRMRRPGSEYPHQPQWNFFLLLIFWGVR